MIHNYTFENFQSFADETFIDFSSNSKILMSDFDTNLYQNKNVSKVISVFGANGSGKSNLVKPLVFLSWFISRSFKHMEPNEEIPISPHALRKNKDTSFNIEFSVHLPDYDNDDELIRLDYKYNLVLNRHRVMREALFFKATNQFSRVFSREYIPESDKYEIKGSTRLKLKESDFRGVASNCSVLSYLSRNESLDPIIQVVPIYFQRAETNLNFYGRTGPYSDGVLSANEFFYNNKDFLDKAKQILEKLDIQIDDFSIVPSENKDSNGVSFKIYEASCLHSMGEETFWLPIEMESGGTKSLYSLLARLIPIFDTGCIAIIDEVDGDMHPKLVSGVIDLFKDKDINPHNSQLIFTCHTPEVMNDLELHHIYLVERENSCSETWRLDQIDGLRRRDNLYAKYLTGALGGIPNID